MTAQAAARGIPWSLRVLGAGVSALLPFTALAELWVSSDNSNSLDAFLGSFFSSFVNITAMLLLLPLLLPALCWLAGWRLWVLGLLLLLALLAFPAYRMFGPTTSALLALNLLPAALLLAVRPRKPDHPV